MAQQYDCPPNVEALVWAGACALALHRHPRKSYPQPSDIDDARIVLAARNREMLALLDRLPKPAA